QPVADRRRRGAEGSRLPGRRAGRGGGRAAAGGRHPPAICGGRHPPGHFRGLPGRPAPPFFARAKGRRGGPRVHRRGLPGRGRAREARRELHAARGRARPRAGAEGAADGEAVIPEIGQLALVLATLLAATQATLPVIGAARRIPAWMALARPAAQGQLAFVAIAFACLAWSFVTNDFSVANVAANSNSQLPLHYRLAATWGSHEGSLLLWVLMLAGWTVAVSLLSRHLPAELAARVLGVMGFV